MIREFKLDVVDIAIFDYFLDVPIPNTDTLNRFSKKEISVMFLSEILYSYTIHSPKIFEMSDRQVV